MSIRAQVALPLVRRRAAAACALAILTSSCASSGEVQSNTPRVTVDTGAPESSLLLMQSDVRAIDGLAELVAQDINQVPVFENPDPRGPCGGAAPSPPINDAVGRAFTDSNTSIVELIAVASTEADTYLSALRADRVASCGPFKSTTNTGSTQTISQVEFVDLGSIGGEGIAWTARVDVGQAGGFIGVGAILASGHLALIQAQSGSPFDTATLPALVQRAATKLNE